MWSETVQNLRKFAAWLKPKPDQTAIVTKLQKDSDRQAADVRALTTALTVMKERQQAVDWEPANLERAVELVEARQMSGSGPWLVYESRKALAEGKPMGHALREADPLMSQGAFGDIELALQNVTWKREINLSWLEFSRWGIQQIILISRLYYLKNPIVRRLVDVRAAYVFARGVEVTTDDDTANEVLQDFINRNRKVLGSVALVETERQKDMDGNVFWVFFADTQSKGDVNIRTIDATEMQDIICDPNDASVPQLYRRVWTARNFNTATGTSSMTAEEAWYPAINYDPPEKPATILGKRVHWDQPIYHRKCGHVAKWLFGCPRIYPMLDWAKESRKFLEACASVRQSLSQIALVLSTKGGQQALDSAKQQLQTTIGPAASTYDMNPPAVFGAIFGSGTATKLEAFKTQGSTFSPEDVRQFKLMCCMVAGVPETFLGDVSTGNLATATSLDRPTETIMLALQEEWQEDLEVIAGFVLKASDGAAGGRLREALDKQKIEAGVVCIREAKRHRLPSGRYQWLEAKKPTAGTIKVVVNFPAIREGDMAAVVSAIVEAGTLGNKSGDVKGIDAKAMIQALYRALGIEDGDALAELQYPTETYDPERDMEEEPAEPTEPLAGEDPEVTEARRKLRTIAHRLAEGLRQMEAEGQAA